MTQGEGRGGAWDRGGLDRRSLLKGAAALAVAGGIGSGARAAPGRLIDAHSHCWGGDLARYPMVNGQTARDRDPPDYDIDTVLARETAIGVARVVLVQHIGYFGFDSSYLTDAARAHPGTFAVVGAVDDRRADVAEAMRAAKATGVKGFRLRGVDTRSWLTSPVMATIWATAAEEDLVLCPLLRDSPDMSDDALLHMAEMCRRYPATSVCLDHMAHVMPGDARQLDRLLALSAFPGVTVKVSGLNKFDTPPYDRVIPQLVALIAAFGAGRLMWGSDMPVLEREPPNTMQAAFDFIARRAPLDDGQRDFLLRGTAERVFFGG
ncbi:amidohydrolase family protein [Xanthobacter flavus]|uniref:amidohydrolase family protein n=1 Tax=Xanthobacter flavus TaxID=281 RepID=UPI00372AC6B5